MTSGLELPCAAPLEPEPVSKTGPRRSVIEAVGAVSRTSHGDPGESC